jgi:hypothetical protein
VLDAVRLGPDDDETEVTAAQVREVITRLIEAGRPYGRHVESGDAPDRLLNLRYSALMGCRSGRWL